MTAVAFVGAVVAARYDGPVPLSVEVPLADPSIPMFRQRRRLADILGGLDAEQWAFPSRCSGWSVHDVAAHLVGVNRFWSLSVRSGLAGAPTRLLTAFDPVTTPQSMVEPMRALSHEAILSDYIESVDELAATFDGVDGDSWSLLAEAPPGHVALQTLVLHALWDGWVHERDIALPLGLTPGEEVDEVTACLLYAAILGPTISAAAAAASRSGTLVVKAEQPPIEFVVAVGDCVVARPRVPGTGTRPSCTVGQWTWSRGSVCGSRWTTGSAPRTAGWSTGWLGSSDSGVF